MGKIHKKNGFEYHCEKSYWGGHWSHYWYVKPIGEPIFLLYTPPFELKTLKVDVEKLLSNYEQATQYYYDKLKIDSDVESAERNLATAKNRYDKVNSPDFDLKGNNPNAESRARRNAEDSLYAAESRLKKAKEYREILAKK